MMFRVVTLIADDERIEWPDLYDSVEAAEIDIHLFIADYHRHHPGEPRYKLTDFDVVEENDDLRWERVQRVTDMVYRMGGGAD